MGIGGNTSDYISLNVVAVNDFSNKDKLGRAVTRGGEFADTGLEAFGVCMDNVSSGQHMQVGVSGNLKYRPINVVSAGYLLTVTTSGFFLAAAANTYAVGFALGGSGADGANTESNALCSAWITGVRNYISTISGSLLVG